MKKLFLSIIAFLTISILHAQPPAGNANVGDQYGNPVSKNSAVKGKKLIGNLKKNNGEKLDAKVAGTVLEVCPKKGCWIKLQLDDKSVATVKMKDYAFFVPTALEGKRIMVEGKAEMAETSVKELKHLAEDAKKSPEEIEAITAPKQEIKILADGIEVIK
jgi:hypothetical protein